MTARLPGPLGWEDDLNFDPGLLDEILRVPGPTGLWFLSPLPMQVKATRNNRVLGLIVHPESRITGQQWNDMIDRNPNIPDYVRDQVEWKNDAFIAPNRKKYRRQIPKGLTPLTREWVRDWHAGIYSSAWEITTHELELVVGPHPSREVKQILRPHLSKKERLDYVPLEETKPSIDHLKITYGWTLERMGNIGPVLASGRHLIIVAPELVLTMKGAQRTEIKKFTLTEDELLEILVHEVSVHAGRTNQNLKAEHCGTVKDEHCQRVDDLAQAINVHFKGGEASMKVGQTYNNQVTVGVGEAIKAFFEAEDRAAQGRSGGRP